VIITDDFNDGVIDSDLWEIIEPSWSEAGGELIGQSEQTPEINSKFWIAGNFLVTAKLWVEPTPPNDGLYYSWSTEIVVFDMPGVAVNTIRETSGTLWRAVFSHGVPCITISQNYVWAKIERIGAVVKCYYKLAEANSWILLQEIACTEDTKKLCFCLCESRIYPHSGRYDDFYIEAGDYDVQHFNILNATPEDIQTFDILNATILPDIQQFDILNNIPFDIQQFDILNGTLDTVDTQQFNILNNIPSDIQLFNILNGGLQDVQQLNILNATPSDIQQFNILNIVFIEDYIIGYVELNFIEDWIEGTVQLEAPVPFCRVGGSLIHKNNPLV